MFNKKAFIPLCLLLAITPQEASHSVRDIDKASVYVRDSILSLVQKKILDGESDGNLNPQKTISRTEMITLLVKSLNVDVTTVPEKATFKDVPREHWVNKYVEAAYREGIVKGVEGDRFGMNEACTREQMAVLFIRALKPALSGSIKNINMMADQAVMSDWARKEIEIALRTGLMKVMGQNSFAPLGFAAKEQAAVMMDRFLSNRDAIQAKVNTVISGEDVEKPELTVVFNGDAIPLTHNTMGEGDRVLVPKSFLI